tara:strand:- start:422 stop:1156 length:735 start_codon:yes stop_codon:yes gene_type:complete
MKTLVIIPSRLSATRLPGKPLLKINGLSMISHVVQKAISADIGEVFVATEDQEIIDDVKKNGGQAILTKKNHKSGTDRVFEAIKKLDKLDTELVINLQGDEPLINIDDIKSLHKHMIVTKSKFGTLASNISKKEIFDNQNIVKVITKTNLTYSIFPEAKIFTRSLSSDTNNAYHHIGVYCYQLETLKKFVSLDQSVNEIKNKLEQLRALDNGININVALAKESSFGVDTEEDFVAIKKNMEYKN